ncbi:MAG: hypothetical protein LBN35_01700 [Clostridiales Family XIII bacterium]|nr:hypothetical protein [Clostridiales Family XIII bacterium]
MTEFRRKVLRSAFLTAAFFAVVAIVPFWAGGFPVAFWLVFVCGITAGTLSSVVNFYIMAHFAELALSRGKSILSAVGLLLRMVIYAGVFIGMFYLFGREVYNQGLAAGIGTALGFLTSLLAIVWVNAVLPMIRARREARRTGGAAEYIYDDEPRNKYGQRRYVLVSAPSSDIWRGDRHYITHKKFRILHELKRA